MEFYSKTAALSLFLLTLILTLTSMVAGCSCSDLECGPGTHQEGNRCVSDETDDGREDILETGDADGADGEGEGEIPGDPAEGDQVDSAEDVEVECNVCTDAEKRCDGQQVQVCVTLTDGCTTWSVEKACSRFEQCQEPAMDCVVPETVPPGSFLAEVSGASWGIGPESMLWDGTTGLLSYSTSSGSIRIMGLLRFNAAGPVRPARTSTIDDQESSLAAAAGRTFVHWRDFASHGSIGEVLSDESMGTSISSDHNSMGQNVHAFGVGTGVFVYQTSVMGGSNAYVGFFDPGSWAITWYADQPLFQWYTSTAAAAGISGGFAASWITSDMSSVALQRFNAAGTPAGVAAVSPLGAPAGDTTALALLPDAEGFTFVWVTDFTLHLSRFDGAGALLADAEAETGDLRLRNARWVGSEGEELFISCDPATSGTALVIAQLSREGALLGDRLLTSHGGIAAYAGGNLAACWGIPDVGISCGVVSFP